MNWFPTEGSAPRFSSDFAYASGDEGRNKSRRGYVDKHVRIEPADQQPHPPVSTIEITCSRTRRTDCTTSPGHGMQRPIRGGRQHPPALGKL